MAKETTSFELILGDRPANQTVTNWLYAQLRMAIAEGRLRAGARLPASRDFANQYGMSRGIIVSVFERLQAEGYVTSRIGSGTLVSQVALASPARTTDPRPPAYVRRVIANYSRPKPWRGLVPIEGVRPFSMRVPALDRFPAQVWGRIAARRARSFSSWLQSVDDGRGYRPLREAIADYLRLSRGARCHAGQIVIVSGVQQALDLLSRVLLRPGDAVWMEDPGYFGATIVFNGAGVRMIPAPIDEQGLSISTASRACPNAKGAYVTPGHQFPLGVTMSLERRAEILRWASTAGAFVIEDDYDSEFRFEGPPIPAMQGLDRNSSVILVGSFNKLLFPSLRIGYVVLPEPLVDVFLAFRYRTDSHHLSADQAVLCDFIQDGHLGSHLRRMREVYASRLSALIDGGRRYLNGVLEICGVRAGLYTAAFLKNGMSSRQAEKTAAEWGVEVIATDRYTLSSPDPKAVLLGFAAFDENEIRAGLSKLARAWKA